MLVLVAPHPVGNLTAEVVEVHIYRAIAVGVVYIDNLAAAPWRYVYARHIAFGRGKNLMAYLGIGANVEAAVKVVGPHLAKGRGEREVEV